MDWKHLGEKLERAYWRWVDIKSAIYLISIAVVLVLLVYVLIVRGF